MRPVRFVALSEDGHALVLADEVGRLLALPLDTRVHTALRTENDPSGASPLGVGSGATVPLSPREIQAKIRSGESADDVARIAGVPVDRVLRYAGPVLQERAMLAQHARRTKLKTSDKGASLAEVVDARLSQHGIDTEKISWDAYRRDDGTWRVVATWPSGKATAQAIWELDKSRKMVTPQDDMAHYLCAERPTQILGQDPPAERGGRAMPGRAAPGRGESGREGFGREGFGREGFGREEFGRGEAGRGELARGGHEPMRPDPETARRESRPGRGPAGDPIRAGRDALLASLDRPLETSGGRARNTAAPAVSTDTGRRVRSGGAAALIGGSGPAFDDDGETPKDGPAVPSLAVLRPRRVTASAVDEPGEKPRKRLPSWDDVLFGGGPAARGTS